MNMIISGLFTRFIYYIYLLLSCMNKYILIDLPKLYNIYFADDVDEYYSYDFLHRFKEIDVDIVYDVINTLQDTELVSLHNYIARCWNSTSNNIKEHSFEPSTYHTMTFSFERKMDNESFNKKLGLFIMNNPISSIYVINTMIKFLYPCNNLC